MLINPGILSLVCCSALLCLIATVAVVIGASVMLGWNPDDGSEHQLRKERRGYLIGATLKSVFWLELFSFFLFVFVADRIHSLLSGAMCAAGTFNANQFGFPALLAKLAVFGLCGLWLISNKTSSAAGSKNLIWFKQGFLLVIWGGLLIEFVLQYRFFSGLDADVLTSCCATMFNEPGTGLSSNIASAPVKGSLAALFLLLSITLFVGLLVRFRGTSPVVFSVLSAVLGLACGVAIVSWIAPAYYQLPTHHCPFCLLTSEVTWVGYPIFASLSIAVITGLGAGIVNGVRFLDPLNYLKPSEEIRLCTISMAAFTVFAAFAIWPVIYSSFRLEVI